MMIQLLNAAVGEKDSSGKQFLQCSFLVDGDLREMGIEIIKKGESRFLVLDSWEDMFQGQDEAFQKMRAWLFMPLRGLSPPKNAVVELEDHMADDENGPRPGFF